MRIALAQVNPTLGDFEYNAEKILEYSKRALERHADIVVFPEASLFGYHPMDLLERPSVVDAQMKVLKSLLKKLPKEILIVFGAFTPNANPKGKPYFNSVVVVKGGEIKFQCGKSLLPTYDVFDDARHIEPGDMSKNIFRYKGKKILFTVCEDIWAWPLSSRLVKSHYPDNPILKLKSKDVDLVVNISASPYHIGKFEDRKSVVQSTAKHLKSPLIYVNMFGAQDEIIFDGGSFAVNASGKIIAQSVFFQEDLNLVDLTSGEGGFREPIKNPYEQMRQALVTGIRDFTSKIGMTDVHLGLSGGIDSAVVACLAADAMGPDHVTAFALPGPFSSNESLEWAKKLANNLGVNFHETSINEAYMDLIKNLEKSVGPHSFGIMEENIQSRLRGLILMAFSNREQSLLLNTSNKTEFASGYGTLYGDMAGGLCVIGDLLKEDVYKLAEHYNLETELIPSEILKRAPSAELRPNQTDQDFLPPYEELDPAVQKLVEEMKPAKKPAEKFLLKALLRSEFKRWQAPPILKVRRHSFGRGRRMPVAHRAIY